MRLAGAGDSLGTPGHPPDRRGPLADARRRRPELDPRPTVIIPSDGANTVTGTAVPTQAPRTGMKWWGWGHDGVAFTHEDKPELGAVPPAPPRRWTSTRLTAGRSPSSALEVPEPALPERPARRARGAPSAPEHVSDRRAATGSCTRAARACATSSATAAATLGRLPDVVVRPGGEDEVAARAARGAGRRRGRHPVRRRHEHLRQPRGARRARRAPSSPSTSAGWTACWRSTPASRLARVQAGVFGPHLEEQLNARGLDARALPRLLHPLDARRLDRDALVGDAVRQVRRRGRPHARRAGRDAGRAARHAARARAPRPARACARWCSAARGGSGIITEATVHVHRVPERRVILGYLFPDWARALAAMRRSPSAEVVPSVTRVSDPPETQFSFATPQGALAAGPREVARAHDVPARAGAASTSRRCASRSSATRAARRHVAVQRRLVGRIVSAATAGCASGSGPGALYDQKKFDTPYIRDYLLDRGALGDVSETAAPWSVLPGALRQRDGGRARRVRRPRASPATSCATCRTPTTPARASTSRSRSSPPGARDPLEEYDVVKAAIQQTFMDSGATLSHHHAVGTEHARWLEQDISAAGRRDGARALRRHRPRRQPQPGQDRLTARRLRRRGWRSASRRRASPATRCRGSGPVPRRSCAPRRSPCRPPRARRRR